MENIVAPWFLPWGGVLAAALKPDIKLQMVAVRDIGEFAATCFEQPERFLGKEIELAGDVVTIPDMVEALSGLLDQKVSFQPILLEEVEKAAGHDFAVMSKWFNDVGYSVDIPALERDYGVRLTKFRGFVSGLDKSRIKALARSQAAA